MWPLEHRGELLALGRDWVKLSLPPTGQLDARGTALGPTENRTSEPEKGDPYMGFFDEYVAPENPGGEYISAETLGSDKAEFTITAVVYEPEQGYEGADRYLASIILDGEEKKASFGAGSVDSRDQMLAAMAEFIQRTGETVKVRAGKQGRSVILTAAA